MLSMDLFLTSTQVMTPEGTAVKSKYDIAADRHEVEDVAMPYAGDSVR